MQFGRKLLVEAIATFHKGLERIRFEHLCPEIAVVSGRVIVAVEQVPEVRQAMVDVSFEWDAEALEGKRPAIPS